MEGPLLPTVVPSFYQQLAVLHPDSEADGIDVLQRPQLPFHTNGFFADVHRDTRRDWNGLFADA